jgi:hypothetical protein
MSELLRIVSELRRPRLLIRAARFGLLDYNRNRDLKRLLHGQAVPHPENALEALLSAEADLEQTRLRGALDYSLTRHIDILIAVIAEERLLARPALSAI